MNSFAYSISYFAFVVFAHVLAIFHPKVRKGVLGRYRMSTRLSKLVIPSSQKTIWFHVASSGEFEQLLPILDCVKKEMKNIFIYVSYYSPSAERAISLETKRRAQNQKEISWDASDYSPFDFKGSVRKVLSHLKPVCFVAIHREIWPVLLKNCKKRSIPAFLFAAYFPERSKKQFWKYRPYLPLFNFIGAVDEKTVDFLKTECPSISCEKMGDSRVERVVARRSSQKQPSPYAAFFENQEVVVLGSIWPKDFSHISEAIAKHPKKRFIFVPHEPNAAFSKQIIDELKKSGLKTRLWSRWLLDPETTSHLIYDEVGGLFELYSIAKFAFVGGSFVKKVHNVLEPAAYSLPILTGPLIENSREALTLKEKGALFVCQSGEDISKHLTQLEDPSFLKKTQEKLVNFIQTESGSSAKYTAFLSHNI